MAPASTVRRPSSSRRSWSRAALTWSALTAAWARRRCSRLSSASAKSYDVWLSAQPNAGKPRDIEGRNLYLCSPEYMASYARRFIALRRAAGRRVLRDDAGTHPADCAGGEVDGARAGAARCAVRPTSGRRSPASRTRRPAVTARQKSALARKLVNGQFVARRRAAAATRPRRRPRRSRRAARCASTRRGRGDDSRRPAVRRAA